MGPLAGVSVVEFAGLGPGPFCGMLLADLGASVLRIDQVPRKPSAQNAARTEVLGRGRRSIALNLKDERGLAVAQKAIAGADVLIEGFRPGVMEKLGLGPDACLTANPRLVYGRMTGWGQDGPLAKAAGHDINYIALSGALHSIGRQGQKPTPPPGLVGDFGGGGMLLALGIVSALFEAKSSGRGQVIDAAVCEGSALLCSLLYGWRQAGLWQDEAGTNVGDGGPHFYDVYVCKDGGMVALGAIEPQFYRTFLGLCGIDDPALESQAGRADWPGLKTRLEALFLTRTRAEWCALLEGSDACFAPVLSMAEAPAHPHNQARASFSTLAGVVQPSPAPRFSRTPAALDLPPPQAGEHTLSVLEALGYGAEEIAQLAADQVAWAAPPQSA
jgi:alpha-methylacyl-CoA racemase